MLLESDGVWRHVSGVCDVRLGESKPPVCPAKQSFALPWPALQSRASHSPGLACKAELCTPQSCNELEKRDTRGRVGLLGISICYLIGLRLCPLGSLLHFCGGHVEKVVAVDPSGDLKAGVLEHLAQVFGLRQVVAGHGGGRRGRGRR